MLNELYNLSGCLPKNIELKNWHPKLKTLPKVSRQKPCYRVLIGAEGVADIEPVRELPRDLRKWESAAGQSYPAFNIRPLYVHKKAGKETKKTFDDFLKKLSKSSNEPSPSEAISSWLQDSDPAWPASDIERIRKCLNAMPAELRRLVGQAPDGLKAWDVLLEHVVGMDAQGFHQQLTEVVKQKISRGQVLLDYVPLLLHVDETKKLTNSVAVLLDISEASFEYPVQSSKVIDWLNTQLNEAGTTDPTSRDSGDGDAFGKGLAGWEEKLPEVTLPILGPVKLRAMNHESPCQHRYGRIDAKSYVVGNEVRKQTKAALEWLVNSVFQGKTWVSAARAADTKELLFAYPAEIPEEPPAMAGMFGGVTENTAGDANLFAEHAARVTNALKGIPKPLNEIEVRVFALRKMDKARTQVALNRHYTAERIVSAAEDWQIGCRNLPSVQIGYFPQGERKPVWSEPLTPFPLETIWCLNTVWSHLGTQAARAKQFTAEDGVRLLLDNGIGLQQLGQRMLTVAVRNLGDLLTATAQQQHQGKAHTAGGKFNKQSTLTPAIFGLLLDKLGHKKEVYMKSAPYLVGRLLSLADQLHYHYCVHVRDGSVPPQLMGNALMPTALEEPVKALALYCNRILPYQAWAKTVSGDPARLAHYFLNALGRVCSELGEPCSDAPLSIPERCADVDKAQMLIGYLARSEKSDSKTILQGDEK